MADSFSPNKGLILMATGGDIGTWGANLNNDALSIIDNNLGGNITKSVAGGIDITLSASEAENVYYNFTGVLTGSINVIWPTGAGFYIVTNSTTGAFTLTVKPIGGAGLLIVQGATVFVFISTNTGTAIAVTQGSVNAGTIGQLAYYAASGNAVSGDANVTVSNGALTLGQATSVQGSLALSGSTSGTTTLAAPVAGTGTMTLHAGTDTIVGAATTDTLTNKTYDTAGTGNVLKVNGTQITAISGNTGTVGTTTGTLTSGNVVVIDASGNLKDGGTPSAFGSSYVLLGNATASSSATVAFTSIPSGYDQYEVRVTNAVPASNAQGLSARVSENNGISYISTNTYYMAAQVSNVLNGAITTGSNLANAIFFSSLTSSNTASLGGVSGRITFYSLPSSSINKYGNFQIEAADAGASGSPSQATGSFGYVGDTNAVNAVQFFFPSGNIASGKFSLYGIRNS